MTPSQYWDEDVCLVKAYREAHRLKQRLDNQNAWLIGLYVYEAMCCASPLLNAFSKAKKPMPYRSQPHDLYSDPKPKTENTSYKKIKSKMEAFAAAFNKKFKGGSAKDG